MFVVWEPVITTDIAAPTTAKLALIHDARARQYWDRDRALSREIVRSVLANPSRYALHEELEPGSVVWDAVILFPANESWTEDLPVPIQHGFPVIDSMDSLRAALASLREAPGAASSPSSWAWNRPLCTVPV